MQAEQRLAALEDAVFSSKRTLHNRIKGRFGNQLFQFWIGKWIATNTNMTLTTYFTQGFYLDPAYFPNIGPYIKLTSYKPIKRPIHTNIPDNPNEIIYNRNMQ